MQRFAAKRHLVRQALQTLDRMGIVHRDRNKGAQVRDFSPTDVEEIYEIRALLHERATRRIPLPAPSDLIARLEEMHRRHGEAVDAADLRQVYHLNNRFHGALFGACGNRHLAEAIAHYAWLAHAIRSYRIADPLLLAQARDEHGAMIAALSEGDRERLVRLCVDHIEPSKRVYLEARGPVVVRTGAIS
jgi:DNA-binding GntR family transcriptional regulator